MISLRHSGALAATIATALTLGLGTSAHAAVFVGTPGYDGFVGTSDNDSFDTLAGNDNVFGLRGDDIVVAGAGDDFVVGDGQCPAFFTDPQYCSATDAVQGGNDSLYAGNGADTVFGGPGADIIDGDATLIGGTDDLGEDIVDGGPGRDGLFPEGGDDVVYARDGQADTINCGAGNDEVFLDQKDTAVFNCEIMEFSAGRSAASKKAQRAKIRRYAKTHKTPTIKSYRRK